MSVSLPQIDYLVRDYDNIRADLLAVIKNTFVNWEAVDETDFGIMIVDLVSRVGDNLGFYLDRYINEAFLETAKQRQSVINLLKLIDYELSAPTASSVPVTVVTSDHTVDILIPENQKITTGTGLVFEVDQNYIIPAGTNNIIITAIHGETMVDELLGTSDGTANQEFTLSNSPYIYQSETIEVNSISWTRVDTFLFSSAVDKHYRVLLDVDGNATIIFGDGTNGAIPGIKQSIMATEYRIGGGSIGNISVGVIRAFSPAITGVISVTNLVAGSGGSDLESTEDAKVNGPRSLQTLNRAVTLEDFEDLSTGYSVSGSGTIQKAKAIMHNWYTVWVYIAPEADVATQPTNTLKTSLQAYLQDRSMATHVVECKDPTYIDIKLTATIYVEDNYDLDERHNQAMLNILKEFSYSSLKFGQDGRLSDAYEALTFEGIEHVDITEFCLTSENNKVENISVEDLEILNLERLNITITSIRAE